MLRAAKLRGKPIEVSRATAASIGFCRLSAQGADPVKPPPLLEALQHLAQAHCECPLLLTESGGEPIGRVSRIDHGPPFAADAGALFAHSPHREKECARSTRRMHEDFFD
jgi:hypothetical protein